MDVPFCTIVFEMRKWCVRARTRACEYLKCTNEQIKKEKITKEEDDAKNQEDGDAERGQQANSMNVNAKPLKYHY